MNSPVQAYLTHLNNIRPALWRGKLMEANGQWVEAEGPVCDVGECCEVRTAQGHVLRGEVIGFRKERVVVMLVESATALRYGDEIVAMGEFPSIGVGDNLLGRVINADGQSIDGKGPIVCDTRVNVHSQPPPPFGRVPIDECFSTGVRSIDGMLAMGRGQRVGIFGGSGVGKSTLIGMLSRASSSQVAVIALIGERGREVLDFVENNLGIDGLSRSVLVVSTSDESPLMKMRAAQSATSIAEYFQRQGQDVLLILDSITRYAMAAREVGLANGEPPTNKGYTPSVFSKLAKLVERAGRFSKGSITAVYTVLMEGDDQQDPIVDAVRSFVDGHIILSQDLALDGWYPPIDILSSVSRLMPAVASKTHSASAARMRKMIASYAKSEDLVRIGAYRTGADIELDQAIAMRPRIRRFLEQVPDEVVKFPDTLVAMEAIMR